VRAHAHKEAGFTLVEVLISLFIFALITVGTMTFENGALIRRSYAHENPAQEAASFDRILLDDLRDTKLYAVVFQFNDLSKIDGLRLEQSTNDALTPNAILIEITDEFGELTEHLFEIGV